MLITKGVEVQQEGEVTVYSPIKLIKGMIIACKTRTVGLFMIQFREVTDI